MSEPGQQQGTGDSFKRTVVKKALAPVVATAATAGHHRGALMSR